MPEPTGSEVYGDFASYYDMVNERVVDYEGDVLFLQEVFKRFAGRPIRRILDLGCGTGNHAVGLARAGIDVDGVDLSEEFLKRATKKADEGGLSSRTRFHHADMAESLPPGPFDAAVSMFGSFNYVIEDDRCEHMVAMVADRMPDGGLFVFEFWNPIGIRPDTNWERTQADDGRTIYQLFGSQYRMMTGIITLTTEVIVLRGTELEAHFQEKHHLRARTPAEVEGLLGRHGFEVVAYTRGERQGKGLQQPSHDTQRVMVIAKRR